MYKNHKNYVSLMVWIVSLIFIGSVIGLLTNSSIDTWYVTLNRSPLTPPDYLFGIAWSILYAMIGVSGWLIWQTAQFPQLQWIKRLYIIQLILNWSWTPLFFYYQRPDLALICIALLVALVFMLIIKAHEKLKLVSLLLVPYSTWLLFATYLNFYIWKYN